MMSRSTYEDPVHVYHGVVSAELRTILGGFQDPSCTKSLSSLSDTDQEAIVFGVDAT